MRSSKFIITIFFGLAVFASCNSKSGQSDQERTNTEDFEEVSKEDGFAEQHDEPRELEEKNIGEMISVPVEGGESANVYALKNPEKTNKFLFVIHEWWGLNQYVKNEADQWYEKLGDVNVIALDLYDGKVASTRENAQKYMKGVSEERIQAIIDGTIKLAGPDADIATIGWCFGGGWSLRTALRAGEKTKACVMYYGMPVKDIDRLKELNSDVLFIYGTQDKWINKEVANEFKENMIKVDKQVTILSFEANHAFANPTQESYVKSAAQEANQSALDFLQKRM